MFAISGDSVALRQLMIVAHSLGMLEGDYVFIYFESFRGNGNGNIHWKRGDQYDEVNDILFMVFTHLSRELMMFAFQYKT